MCIYTSLFSLLSDSWSACVFHFDGLFRSTPVSLQGLLDSGSFLMCKIRETGDSNAVSKDRA